MCNGDVIVAISKCNDHLYFYSYHSNNYYNYYYLRVSQDFGAVEYYEFKKYVMIISSLILAALHSCRQLLQYLWCMHSSLATIPIATCTSAGVLRHTFYLSCRPDVISSKHNEFHVTLPYVKMAYSDLHSNLRKTYSTRQIFSHTVAINRDNAV